MAGGHCGNSSRISSSRASAVGARQAEGRRRGEPVGKFGTDGKRAVGCPRRNAVDSGLVHGRARDRRSTKSSGGFGTATSYWRNQIYDCLLMLAVRWAGDFHAREIYVGLLSDGYVGQEGARAISDTTTTREDVASWG